MLDQYIEQIYQSYPELLIKDYEQNSLGQNNDVLIINKSLVFRFPKYKSGIEELKKEIELLKIIKDEVFLEVPNPIYASLKDEKVGKVFTGYKSILGTPLCKEKFKSVDEPSKRKIASQLVTFLKQLHGIQVDESRDIFNNKMKDSHEVFSELYKKIKENLFTYMTPHAKSEVTNQFEHALTDKSLFDFKPKLIHGDFGASNILWDTNSQRVTGIIDFGGTQLGDPAYDFAGILSSYGEEFFNLCLSLYNEDCEFIKKRVIFYKSTFALQEALHGFLHNDKEAFESGIKNYRI